MAKKVNKKVAIIGIVLLVMIIGGAAGLVVIQTIRKNPNRALAKAEAALAAGDYETAERQYGRAYAFGKTDAYKIERLEHLADFHLVQNDQHQAEWNKALGCWKQIVSIDPGHVEARRRLLDYYLQAAETGDDRLWKIIKENTTDLIDALEDQQVQPDAELRTHHAKASLMIAKRGDTPNRKELLGESLTLLESLLEQHPEDAALYQLRAEAAMLEGQLNELAGIRNAEQQARQAAEDWLRTGTEKADDRAAATVAYWSYQMQTTPPDPNATDRLRTEIEAAVAALDPAPELSVLVSRAYSERQGNLTPQAETNRAIEALRQGREQDPDNVEYAIRMARLLYRKGSAFDDTAAVTDALDIAEAALALPGTQDTPGPLRGRNLMYRYLLNTFIADIYLEKAFAADRRDDAAAVEQWVQKAQPRVKEISDYRQTADDPVVLKFQGMVDYLQGDRDKGLRQMYKAYEQSKALDQADQPSQIDPILCITLADIMAQRNEPGMRREFLQKAISNQAGIIAQKPHLLLDYARLFTQPGGWPSVLAIVNNYQNRYGATADSHRLMTEALIATEQFDQARAAIDAGRFTEPEAMTLTIDLLSNRITQLTRAIDADETAAPTDEQTQQIAALRQQRQQLARQLLDTAPEQIQPQTLATVCYELIRDERTAEAEALLDGFLAVRDDNITLQILRLQTREDNPLAITPERQQQIQKQVLEGLDDPTDRHLGLAHLHRSSGEPDAALAELDQITGDDADSADVLMERFEIALTQNDLDAAERLSQTLRAQNADQCDGALLAARLAMARQDSDIALRNLDTCLTILPLSSRLYFLKGQVYNSQQNYESAIENFRRALQMNPQNPLYARSLASVIFARNTALASKVTPQQKADALQAIQLAMYLEPTDWQLQSIYAETIAEANPDQALRIRRRLLKNRPNAANALMLANMAMRMARSEWDAAKKTGLAEMAGSAYQQALELEPDNETAQQAYADYLRLTGKSEDAIAVLGDDENLLWKYYLRNSQFEQAREILDKLLAASPDDSLLLQGRVLTAEGLGDRQQVQQALAELAAADDSKNTQLFVLQKYLDHGYVNEAEKKLAGFKEQYPDETLILLIEAWTQMGAGNLDDALALTNRYLETNTENAGAWRLRGRIYRLKNEPQKAVSDLQRSKSIQADPMVRLELAAVYREMANPEAAIGELKQGLTDPQSPLQLRLTLEAIYETTGKTRELEAFFASTLEKYPQSYFWHYRAGDYYRRQQRYSTAQQHLKTAWDLSLQQNNLDLGIFLAYLDSLYQDAQYDAALTVAAEWIDSPLAPAAYAVMGQIQARQNKADDAAKSFHTALDKADVNDRMQGIVLEKILASVGADVATAWIEAKLAGDAQALPPRLLAYRLALQNERYNAAIEQMQQCLDIVGSDHPGRLSLSIKQGNAMILAYTKTADPAYLDRSIELFEAIVAEQPNNASLLNNLAYLLADNDKQLDTALQYARKAHQAHPGNSVFLDTYAYVQCKLQQYEAAERNLLRAIQILDISREPIPWDMYKHLGMARRGLGKNRQAAEAYQKALDTAEAIPAKEKQKLETALDELKLLY